MEGGVVGQTVKRIEGRFQKIFRVKLGPATNACVAGHLDEIVEWLYGPPRRDTNRFIFTNSLQGMGFPVSGPGVTQVPCDEMA